MIRRVSILIPSRLATSSSEALVRHKVSDTLLIDKAIASVRSQTISKELEFEILVGVDAGSSLPPHLASKSDIRFAESRGQSQAAALNAAAKTVNGDLIAILEDDDQWEPMFLEESIRALQNADFVSSTQLEVTPDGEILRVNDYPTPSGWVMKRATWELVGPFNEFFRWHLDSEWLGRLALKQVPRVHLVEATAPIDVKLMVQVRPWLERVLKFGGPSVRIHRHQSPWPLIKRLVHAGSGVKAIEASKSLQAESRAECYALTRQFGHLPW